MTDLKSRDISMAAHGKKNMTPYQQQLAENGERMYTAFRTVMNRRGGKRGNNPEPRWKNLKPWIKQVWIEAAASLVEPPPEPSAYERAPAEEYAKPRHGAGCSVIGLGPLVAGEPIDYEKCCVSFHCRWCGEPCSSHGCGCEWSEWREVRPDA